MELGAQLRDLFDVPVAAITADADTPLSPLVGPEAEIVGPRWSAKRVWEYQAGRHCARLALARLGADPALLAGGILRGEQGAPHWPPGWTGSITHTGQGATRVAACVVSRELRALGIDAEVDEPLQAELQRRVLTADEWRAACALHGSPAELGRHALLAFSAKEAFYKCQFPVSGIFLGFHEVETEIDLERGTFSARCLRPLGQLAAGEPLRGRFFRSAGLVVTAVMLPGFLRAA